MGYDFNPDILLAYRPPQLPDPMAQATRAMTLANLSDTQSLKELQVQEAQRKKEAQDAYNRVIGNVYAQKFSPDAVSAAIAAEPKSADLVLSDMERHRKSQGDYEEKSAKAFKERTDANLAMLKPVADMAFKMANDPNLSPDMIKQWHGIVASNGLEKLIPTVPFQAWQTPESARKVLSVAGSAFYAANDQVKNAEEARAHGVNENLAERKFGLEDWAKRQEVAQGWGRINKESLGAPIEVTIDGKPGFAAFNKKGGWNDPATGQPITGRVEPKNPTSATMIKDLAQNNVSIQNIDAALAAIMERKSALGPKNFLGDTIAQWVDPKGVETRALVAQIGGQKLHDLSGAAVSASEANRLMPMIPRVTDTPHAAMIKLNNLRRELVLMNNELKSGKSIFEVANARPVNNSGNQTGGMIGGASPAASPTQPTITFLGQ